MTASSSLSIPFRIRRALTTTPAVTRTLQATRAVVHFGPWRHAARAAIRWTRPPRHDNGATPSSFEWNTTELVRALRGDGMVRAGHLPPDVLRRVRAFTDDMPPGEYADFHEQPDIRALVLGSEVLNVVRGYFNAEPELLECNLVVGRAENPARDPVHAQRHFHFDFAGWQSLNLFVYLTEVEPDSGAHQVVIGTHRGRRLRDMIRPWVPDDEINARYPGRVQTIDGPAGTMFFENTEAFHRRLILKQRRVMLNVLYASHRSWLSHGRLTPRYADYAGTRSNASAAPGV